MNFSFIVWVLYLAVYPFYFLPQGGPQVADALGVILLLSSIRPVVTTIFKNDYNRFLFFFVAYTLIVNAIWMLILGKIGVLKHSLYYLYSFLLFSFVFANLNNEKFVKLTVKWFLAILTLQFVLYFIIPDQGVRYQMFFNNPNQLCLWGLCILIISNALHLKYQFSSKLIVSISLLCTFFVLISASRSGLVCLILFWLFFYLKSMRNLIIVSIILVVGISAASISNLIQLEDLTLLNYIVDRLLGVEQPQDAGLAGRGFDRIVEFPQYLVFGAGEGVLERFNSLMELHSSFLNVFFSYGIIGAVLFGRAIISIVVNSYREIIILFIVLALFGHVHMTLRIPLFWITLGVLYFVRENRYAEQDLEESEDLISKKYPHLKTIRQ